MHDSIGKYYHLGTQEKEILRKLTSMLLQAYEDIDLGTYLQLAK